VRLGEYGPVACEHAIFEATIYNWKAKFEGMDVSEAKRLTTLEEQNAELRKLLVEQMLYAAVLRAPFKKMVGPAARRVASIHCRR
jgi:putative transposase